MELLYKDLTQELINVFYEVYNELGYGFLEKVYQNAMYIELKNRGYEVAPQQQIKVHYKGNEVGEYYSDLIVDNLIIIELKAKECLLEEHEAQLINYLRATDKEVGIVMNFGVKPEFSRKLFTNNMKKLKNKK
jgi:GxxExxY protein